MFEVLLSPEAQSFYGAHDPHHHNNIKRLTGELAGRFWFRIGDWRVVYRVDDATERVIVLLIAHRREVYD